jgi:hypothetical protein
VPLGAKAEGNALSLSASFKASGFIARPRASHRVDGAAHGAQDPHVCAAPAQVRLHVRSDFIIARIGILLQQRLRAHDHSSNAVATLRRLFVNESLLNRGWFLRAAETFDRQNLAASERCNRQKTGEYRTTVDHHCARATLAHAASELSGIEP